MQRLFYSIFGPEKESKNRKAEPEPTSARASARAPALRRALTLPLPSSQLRSLKQHTVSQTSSLFFASLPLELRLRIYEELFGYRKVHLIWAPWQAGSWSHSVCTVNPSCSFYFWDDWCRKKEVDKLKLKFDPKSHSIKLDIAMLYTCRQAYSECIYILYSTTTFDFATEPALRQFRLSIVPKRFETIASIDLRWHCSHRGQPHLSSNGKQNWDALWSFFATLPRLRHLRLAVFPPNNYQLVSPEVDFDKAWLGPLDLLANHGMEVFDIGIPSYFYVRFEKNHEGAPYRLLEIFDGT